MKIAIISDTHNNLHNIQAVRLELLTHELTTIIHCGDLTEADILDYFGDFNLFCVYGNGDYPPEVEERLKWLSPENKAGESLEFSLAGKTFFVTHGHIRGLVDKAIKSQRYDFVLHGHTHRFKDITIGSTRVINPGSMGGIKVEERSFVILDLEDGSLERQFLTC